MESGSQVPDNEFLDSLQIAYYEYNDLVTRKDEIMYQQGLTYINQFIFLRNRRLEAASDLSIAPELWWTLLLLFVVLVVMTWFILGDNIYRSLMTILIVAVYGALLFLVLILNLPFRGDFAITAEPFIFIASKFGITCPTNPQPSNVSEVISNIIQKNNILTIPVLITSKNQQNINSSTPSQNNKSWFHSKIK
jgi:hypothetical protein